MRTLPLRSICWISAVGGAAFGSGSAPGSGLGMRFSAKVTLPERSDTPAISAPSAV
ncbi:hypothetical protein [Georgenia yuyongxinii]